MVAQSNVAAQSKAGPANNCVLGTPMMPPGRPTLEAGRGVSGASLWHHHCRAQAGEQTKILPG